MSDPVAEIQIALRIPGTWGHPKELIERLPDGCRCTGEALILPDGRDVWAQVPRDQAHELELSEGQIVAVRLPAPRLFAA